VATGIATAATWLFAASTWAALGPILLVILAVVALIAVIVLIIKHHKEIGAAIGVAWDWIWEKIKWVWQKIQDGAAYVRDYVVERFMTLINFFTSPSARLSQTAGSWVSCKSAVVSVACAWYRTNLNQTAP
jgi:hypothetical protein